MAEGLLAKKHSHYMVGFLLHRLQHCLFLCDLLFYPFWIYGARPAWSSSVGLAGVDGLRHELRPFIGLTTEGASLVVSSYYITSYTRASLSYCALATSLFMRQMGSIGRTALQQHQ